MMMEQPQPVNQASPDQGTATVNKRYSYIDQLLQDFRTAFSLRHTVLMSILIFSLFFVSAILVGILLGALYGVVLFFLGLILAIVLAWATAESVSIYLYLREVREELEQYRQLYTPLAAFVNVYKTPVNYADPDPNKKHDITILVEQEKTHLMILGLPGAGKTIALQAYQYTALQQRLKLLWRWSRAKIPVYIPLRDYNAYLINNQKLPAFKNSAAGNATGQHKVWQTTQGEPLELLLSYLFEDSELTGIRYLWPYLRRLAQQGRIALLCDGLNELNLLALEQVCTELRREMEANRNRVVMTCREFDYREQSVLSSLVGEKEKHAKVALISPLRQEQIKEFIERYLALAPAEGQAWHYHTSDILAVIERTSLSHDCTNPFILVTMMQTMNGMGAERRRQINTRGQLLREFVAQLMSGELEKLEWGRKGLTKDEVVLFLSEVACTARRAGYRNAIRLGSTSPVAGGGTSRTPSAEEVPAALLNWLDEPDVNAPEGETLPTVRDLDMEPLHQPYDRTRVAYFLECAHNARVITLSQNGVLSFRHELIAEYFVAEYLYRLHMKNRPIIPFGQELLGENVSSWSEPVTIWAGFVDDPMRLAGNIAGWADSNRLNKYNTLVLSLVCVGVLWATPNAASLSRMDLPASVQDALKIGVLNKEAREKLAPIFKRCAEEGGINVYRALLPLLPTTEGMADLLLLLGERDKRVLELLFEYLSEIVDKVPYADQVRHLKRAIALFGTEVIPYAEALSQPFHHPYLRAAAIDILGQLPSQGAVSPLLSYLGDPEPTIYEATIKALSHLGPELALSAVVRELQKSTQDAHTQKIHMGTLDILQYFLAQGTTSLRHYRDIIQALLSALAGTYTQQAQTRAKELLYMQALPATDEKDTRWQDVIKLLISALTLQDATLIANVMELLQEVGRNATPFLREQLRLHPAEIARRRILQALGEVRDPLAMEDIVPLLADPSAGIQQEAAETLRKYAPGSIPLLITVVLSTHSSDLQASERAAIVLQEIGKESVLPVSEALRQVAPHGSAMPRGTALLIEVLIELKDTRAVPALITLLQQAAPSHPPLATRAIRALGTFEDTRVIAPLIAVLEQFGPPLAGEASQTLSQLGTSRIGAAALKALLAALDTAQETNKTIGVRWALLGMQPFPKEALLEAFKQPSDALAQQLMRLFRMKADETAPFLVQNLFHEDQRVREYVRRLAGEIDGRIIVPWFIEELRTASWQAVLADYLLKYPESIPLLVQRLGDDLRGKAAAEILFQFGSRYLLALQPALEDQKARRRAQDLIVEFVRQQPEEVLPNVVRMFDPAFFGLPPLPDASRQALMSILTHDLADISLPVLIASLAERRLIPDVSQALKQLHIQQKERREKILQAVLAAFERNTLQEGAAVTLKEIGPPALPGVQQLIMHPTRSVALAAQRLFSEMGPTAFPALYKMYRDTNEPELQRTALDIFRNMPTSTVCDGLVELLLSDKVYDVSNKAYDLEIAVSLLTRRIYNEAADASHQPRIIPALLERARNERNRLRILAALLLLDENVLSRGSIAQDVIDFLSAHKEEIKTYREYIQMLPLLGGDTAEQLKKVVQSNGTPPSQFQIEVAGMLGMMTKSKEVIDYVERLAKYVVQGNPTIQLNNPDPERALYLRVFGGLLASGNCDIKTLRQLSGESGSGSAAEEFFLVLLGRRNAPSINQYKDDLKKALADYHESQAKLNEQEEDLNRLQDEYKKVRSQLQSTRKDLDKRRGELDQARQRIDALENENSLLKQRLNSGPNP